MRLATPRQDFRETDIIGQLPPLPPTVAADVACGERFKEECQVEMFPDQWQTWLVFRTLRDNPERADIPDEAQSFVSRALGDETIHDMQVWVSDPIPAGGLVELPDLPKDMDLSERGRVQAFATACPGWFQISGLAPGPFVAIVIRFVYRGARQFKPWAARKTHFAPLVPTACPIEADWLLDSTFRPLPDEPVPDRPFIIPRIPGIPEIRPPTSTDLGRYLAAPILLAALVLGVVVLKD